jgi:integrase
MPGASVSVQVVSLSVVPSSTYYRVWQEARLLALPPAVAASPLASRPYDLRHSALSTWLNAGVDPTEVAERAGNSVEVLLTRYAKCLDGRQDVANRRIEDLLRVRLPSSTPQR